MKSSVGDVASGSDGIDDNNEDGQKHSKARSGSNDENIEPDRDNDQQPQRYKDVDLDVFNHVPATDHMRNLSPVSIVTLSSAEVNQPLDLQPMARRPIRERPENPNQSLRRSLFQPADNMVASTPNVNKGRLGSFFENVESAQKIPPSPIDKVTVRPRHQSIAVIEDSLREQYAVSDGIPKAVSPRPLKKTISEPNRSVPRIATPAKTPTKSPARVSSQLTPTKTPTRSSARVSLKQKPGPKRARSSERVSSSQSASQPSKSIAISKKISSSSSDSFKSSEDFQLPSKSPAKEPEAVHTTSIGNKNDLLNITTDDSNDDHQQIEISKKCSVILERMEVDMSRSRRSESVDSCASKRSSRNRTNLNPERMVETPILRNVPEKSTSPNNKLEQMLARCDDTNENQDGKSDHSDLTDDEELIQPSPSGSEEEREEEDNIQKPETSSQIPDFVKKVVPQKHKEIESNTSKDLMPPPTSYSREESSSQSQDLNDSQIIPEGYLKRFRSDSINGINAPKTPERTSIKIIKPKRRPRGPKQIVPASKPKPKNDSTERSAKGKRTLFSPDTEDAIDPLAPANITRTPRIAPILDDLQETNEESDHDSEPAQKKSKKQQEVVEEPKMKKAKLAKDPAAKKRQKHEEKKTQPEAVEETNMKTKKRVNVRISGAPRSKIVAIYTNPEHEEQSNHSEEDVNNDQESPPKRKKRKRARIVEAEDNSENESGDDDEGFGSTTGTPVRYDPYEQGCQRPGLRVRKYPKAWWVHTKNVYLDVKKGSFSSKELLRQENAKKKLKERMRQEGISSLKTSNLYFPTMSTTDKLRIFEQSKKSIKSDMRAGRMIGGSAIGSQQAKSQNRPRAKRAKLQSDQNSKARSVVQELVAKAPHGEAAPNQPRSLVTETCSEY